MTVRYTRRALANLVAIAAYVRAANPSAAEAVRNRIEGVIAGLAQFPLQGTPTDDPDIRRLVASPFPYLIYYRVKGDTVIILHIRHGRRRTLGRPGRRSIAR